MVPRLLQLRSPGLESFESGEGSSDGELLDTLDCRRFYPNDLGAEIQIGLSTIKGCSFDESMGL